MKIAKMKLLFGKKDAVPMTYESIRQFIIIIENVLEFGDQAKLLERIFASNLRHYFS